MRKKSQALQIGDYNPVDILPESCFIYQRATEKERLLVALNFSGEEQTFSLADFGVASCLLSTHLDRDGEIGMKDISLRPYEGLVIRL